MSPRPSNGKRPPAQEKPTQVRCAIYCRKSTDENLDSDFNSLDAQREACEAYVASQKHEGWTCLSDRYDDPNCSGGSMDRPALRRLLTDVEAGKLDAVLTYKVDRLSRSLLDFARIFGKFDQHSVSFVAVTQSFNSATSSGRLMLNVLLSFSEFERQLISERTSTLMSGARRRGMWTGGVPLLGFDIDPGGGKLLVNESEAESVRCIFALFLKNESLLTTARELNRIGITPKRWTTRGGVERGGGSWEKTKLGKLLSNWTYRGKVFHRGEVFDGEHQAIVDEPTWQRVQKLLARNARPGGRGWSNGQGALLKGLLRCAPCDASMVHNYSQKKNGARYRYYTCSAARKRGWKSCPAPSLPAGEIEKFVVDRVRAIGTDPRLQGEVLKQAKAAAQELADRIAGERRGTEAELRRHAAEVKRLVGSTERASATTARLAELQELTAAAEQRLAEVHAQETIIKREQIDEADLTAALATFDPIWESLSPREQARVVHLLVERVAYDGAQETVAVTFRPGGIKVLAQEVG